MFVLDISHLVLPGSCCIQHHLRALFRMCETNMLHMMMAIVPCQMSLRNGSVSMVPSCIAKPIPDLLGEVFFDIPS